MFIQLGRGGGGWKTAAGESWLTKVRGDLKNEWKGGLERGGMRRGEDGKSGRAEER